MHTDLPEAAASHSPDGEKASCSTQADGMGNDSIKVPVAGSQIRT